jgi:hypothetical protein
MNLDRASSRYLVSKGLMCDGSGVAVHVPETGAPARIQWEHVIIADDGDVPIGVDLRRRGRLYWLADRVVDGNVRRFVNSSVRQFGESLLLYENFLMFDKPLDEAQEIALCDRLATKLKTVDPAAMKDDEAFWPLILEQTRAGLL